MVSLACTDLGCGIVIPFNTLRVCRWGLGGEMWHLVTRDTWLLVTRDTCPVCRWELGREMCYTITSLVVILLSASVYNFVCVNIDR